MLIQAPILPLQGISDAWHGERSPTAIEFQAHETLGVQVQGLGAYLGFMGSYKWSCKSQIIGYSSYSYGYPTYNPTSNSP